MGQLDWGTNVQYLVKRYSGCVCKDASGWNQNLNPQTEYSPLSLSMWVGLVQPVKVLNWTKGLHERASLSAWLQLGHRSSAFRLGRGVELHHQLSWVPSWLTADSSASMMTWANYRHILMLLFPWRSLTNTGLLHAPQVIFLIISVGSGIRNQRWEKVLLDGRWGTLIYSPQCEPCIGQKWAQALTLSLGFPIWKSRE